MRTLQHRVILFFVILLLAASKNAARADFSASEFVADFNSLNGGQGFVFTLTKEASEVNLSNTSNYKQPDFSAYKGYNTGSHSEGYIRSFCIEPDVVDMKNATAVLNYENGQTRSENSNYAVTLGAAYLYSQFAIGKLAGFEYASNRDLDSKTLKVAIQSAMQIPFMTVENWTTNKFLTHLLELNPDRSYWTQIYDPGQYYDEIGDYAVFAMNVKSPDNESGQNFLFVTSTQRGTDVPEPATLLLWLFGGFGLAWKNRKQRRIAI